MDNLISFSDKFFLAGSKGMVGSAIKKALIKKGYGNKTLGGEIFCPDRNELDLTNFENLKKWFAIHKPSVVIIAAAKVGGIYANSSQPFEFILNNLKIQTNIIELAWEFGVKRLLFLGSSCIYPKNCPQPISEEYLLTSPLESTNEYYAIAKIAGIKLCQSLRIQHKFDSFCLMPTNLYGPGDNYHPEESHVLPSLIRRFDEAKKNNLPSVTCWGTGKPFREFLHVDDLASACVYVLQYWCPDQKDSPSDDKGNHLNYLNVGTGMDISIKDLAERIALAIGYKGKILWDKSKPDGTMRKRLDISRILSLGWRPKINIDDGIRATIENYLEEKSKFLLRG